MARPASPNGPKTPAERKAEQRARDRVAAWSDSPLTDLTHEALLAALGACMVGSYPTRARLLLAEAARRAGVAVTVTQS